MLTLPLYYNRVWPDSDGFPATQMSGSSHKWVAWCIHWPQKWWAGRWFSSWVHRSPPTDQKLPMTYDPGGVEGVATCVREFWGRPLKHLWLPWRSFGSSDGRESAYLSTAFFMKEPKALEQAHDTAHARTESSETHQSHVNHGDREICLQQVLEGLYKQRQYKMYKHSEEESD